MHFRTRSSLSFAVLAVIATGRILAMQQVQEDTPATRVEAPSTRQSPEYVLGPGDEIVIMAVEADEISNKPIRISTAGDISLVTVGRIHAAGKTVRQLEAELIDRLKAIIIRPDVSVTVTQFRSQPVTVLGAVRSPGPVQLEGRRTLLEVLSLVGGPLVDASSILRITRQKEWGPLPLPTVPTDSSLPFSIAEVNMNAIIDGIHPEWNIPILPYDVITVPRAPIVYALGQVNKQGTFVLNSQSNVYALKLLAMAGGATGTAKTEDARIIRPVPDSTRIEILLNLKDIQNGKAKDVMLQPEDILFIPDSSTKRIIQGTLNTMIQMIPGLAIYRF